MRIRHRRRGVFFPAREPALTRRGRGETLHTPLPHPDFDYRQDLGNSGEAPFTRGIHANMYRGREFTMRQLTGFGSPEDTNARMKFMLDHRATGVNVLFDIPTIQMYDSDDPLSQ